jgi:hypothetical protein
LRGEAALFLTTLEDARAGLLSPENADLGA